MPRHTVIVLLIAATAAILPRTAPPTIDAKTAGMERFDGFLPLYWDSTAGDLWMEIDRWDRDFLYVISLPAGLGSNDIGLDRGQLGSQHLVRFERVGDKVLLVEPNTSYRADSDNSAERRAVAESFARSVLWGFEVAARSGSRVLVDMTDFLMRDAHGVAAALKRTSQGSYSLDASRSALYRPRTRNFPDNTEIEVTTTFTGDDPGWWLRAVTPAPQAVTVRQHHSFVALPETPMATRSLDPRAGFFGVSWIDLATPLGEPLRKTAIARHRLEKRDPDAAVSDVVEPIIYYLDPGAPEPVRGALLDGARWWADAFEAAGFRDAFRVEMLPDGADPMDVRFNVIQWVHRATRGWSYGGAVIDPRSGEILKGHVTLGSLRVRQDFRIAEGLLAPYEDAGSGSPDMAAMALARIRQLSAHEVGHTLGLAHNFAASARERASVMDYPHPLVRVGADGVPDLSNAYAVGVGDWDRLAIAYGYRQFASGLDEATALEKIIQDGLAAGLYFISDADARPSGGAHPQAHLWDNGVDPADELQAVMAVRAAALERFTQRAIPMGRPLAELEETLVPIYFYHRYQSEAAVKLIGGLDYRYALRGDGQPVTRPVSGATQRNALGVLLGTLDPASLALPPALLETIPPRAFGMERNRETFDIRTGVTLDPLAAAEAAADHVVALLLDPARAARLVEYHARDADQPGFTEVVEALLKATWYARPLEGYAGAIQQSVNGVVLYRLMALCGNEAAPVTVRALARQHLVRLRETLATPTRGDDHPLHDAVAAWGADRITRFLEKSDTLPLPAPASPPPGSPIGCGGPF